MTQPISDETVLKTITRLVKEEQDLYGHSSMDEHAKARIEQLKVELDQCWDLLRQRRAKREFGKDPDSAQPRDIGTVENYTG